MVGFGLLCLFRRGFSACNRPLGFRTGALFLILAFMGLGHVLSDRLWPPLIITEGALHQFSLHLIITSVHIRK